MPQTFQQAVPTMQEACEAAFAKRFAQLQTARLEDAHAIYVACWSDAIVYSMSWLMNQAGVPHERRSSQPMLELQEQAKAMMLQALHQAGQIEFRNPPTAN